MSDTGSGDRRVRTPKPSTRVPVLIAVAAFTPYLGLPLDIRVEHLIVYGMAFAALPTRVSRLTPRPDPPTRRLIILWSAAAVLITLNTALRASSASLTQRLFFMLSVLDSFLLPLAAFLALTTYALRRDVDARDGLRAACSAIVILLSLNSLLIVLFDLGQVMPFLKLFWSNEANPYLFVEAAGFTSVAARTSIEGRYGGIFNQPFDGGLGYAVGLAAWFVLYTRRARGRGLLASPAAQFVALALVIAGGLSSLSKVFIYGGVLVAVSSLGLPLTGTRATVGKSLAILLSLPLGAIFVAQTFLPDTGERAFGFLGVYGQENAVYTATGGRLTDFASYPERLLSAMSPFGQGWGGIRDDAFLAFAQGGGPIGLLIYLIVLGQLLALHRRLPEYSVERRLALSLGLLAAFSSLGSISLQVNRGSSLLWLLVSLLFARAQRHASARQSHRSDSALRQLPPRMTPAPTPFRRPTR